MKKLLNILFVKRVETENKWWHRLFNVLLFGSAILVFIFTLLLIIPASNDVWVTQNPAVFSFEPNYKNINGKEINCTDFLFSCEGIDVPKQDSDRFFSFFETARDNLTKQFGMDKYDVNNCPHDSSQNPITIEFNINFGKNTSTQGVPIELLNCINKMQSDMKSDPAYPEYQAKVKNLYSQPKIKITKDVHYGLILGDIASWVIIPIVVVLLWIIFWSSVVYRAILYVIFGKRK